MNGFEKKNTLVHLLDKSKYRIQRNAAPTEVETLNISGTEVREKSLAAGRELDIDVGRHICNVQQEWNGGVYRAI